MFFLALTVSKHSVFERQNVADIMLILIGGSNLNSWVAVHMKVILGSLLVFGSQALKFSGDFQKGDSFAHCWSLMRNFRVCSGGIFVGIHFFGICLGSQFSTGCYSSRFYVNDYLCAVIMIYTYSNIFF